MEKRQMRNAERLRWLIQFGSDWVGYQDVLVGTWADQIDLVKARNEGDVVYNDFDRAWALKLSDEALRKLRRER
jgi:predicted phosphohydrolase